MDANSENNPLGVRIDHVFYSIVGAHGNEKHQEIIARKKKEISKAGFSLWAARIDQKSIEQVRNLSAKDKVYVLCKISEHAKEPRGTSKEAGFLQPEVARSYSYDENERIVPDGIKASFQQTSSYQAYFVSAYYDFSACPFSFDFANFVATDRHGISKTFDERLKSSWFQNVYGSKTDKPGTTATRDISLVMELTYPFVVQLHS